MRIVLDVTPLDTGHYTRGIGVYVQGLLQGLLTLKTEHTWLLITHAPSRHAGLPSSWRAVRLPRPALGRLTALATHQLLLPALLQRLQADLVHFPNLSAHVSVTGLPWRIPGPFVVTVHDFTPLHIPALLHGKRVNHWWYARQRAWARRAARLICVSQATREDAVRLLGISPERCPVIYEGVDPRRFHPSDEPRSIPPFILFVGGDLPNKNREGVIQAFAQLCRQTDLPHRLVLVGFDTRSDAELTMQYPSLDLSRVQRVQHLSSGELARLFRQADLFVFPSRHEGFGLPVLEAMASGTPVVTSTTSSLPEIAGDAALLVDPDDVSGLCRAMEHVLRDRGLWSQLQAAGLARAQQFTWERTAQLTLQVYEEAARG